MHQIAYNAVGSIDNVGLVPTTIAFVCAIAVIIFLNKVLQIVKKWSKGRQTSDAYNVVFAQVLHIALLSVPLYIMEQYFDTADEINSENFVAIFFFSMMCELIGRAVLLSLYAEKQFRYLRMTLNNSPFQERATLERVAEHLKIFKGWKGWENFQLFHMSDYLQVTNLIHPLRRSIHLRMIEYVFKSIHDIPAEFNFGRYMKYQYQKYFEEAIEMHPIALYALAALAIINLIRVRLVNVNAKGLSECADPDEKGFRWSEGLDCGAYSMASYGLLLGAGISCLVFACYVLSVRIYKRIIKETYFQSNISRRGKTAEELLTDFMKAITATDKGKIHEDTGLEKQVFIQQIETENKIAAWENGPDFFERLYDIKTQLAIASHRNATFQLEPFTTRLKAWFVAIINVGSLDKQRYYMANNVIATLFEDFDPIHYFRIVSLLLFAHSIYVVMCLTQLLPITKHATNFEVWYICLLLPIIINMWLFYQILFYAVVFRSILRADIDCMLRVLETSVAANATLETIRRLVKRQLHLKHKHHGYERRSAICAVFSEFDDNGDYKLNETEFRTFLAALEVYLDEAQFNSLWDVIDLDQSGYITWDELFICLYPEHKDSTIALVEIIKAFEGIVPNKDKSMLLQADTYKRCFSQYDFEGVGMIQCNELVDMLTSLNVTLPSRYITMLLADIGVDLQSKNAYLSWEQFLDIVIHPCKRAAIAEKDEFKFSIRPGSNSPRDADNGRANANNDAIGGATGDAAATSEEVGPESDDSASLGGDLENSSDDSVSVDIQTSKSVGKQKYEQVDTMGELEAALARSDVDQRYHHQPQLRATLSEQSLSRAHLVRAGPIAGSPRSQSFRHITTVDDLESARWPSASSEDRDESLSGASVVLKRADAIDESDSAQVKRPIRRQNAKSTLNLPVNGEEKEPFGSHSGSAGKSELDLNAFVPLINPSKPSMAQKNNPAIPSKDVSKSDVSVLNDNASAGDKDKEMNSKPVEVTYPAGSGSHAFPTRAVSTRMINVDAAQPAPPQPRAAAHPLPTKFKSSTTIGAARPPTSVLTNANSTSVVAVTGNTAAVDTVHDETQSRPRPARPVPHRFASLPNLEKPTLVRNTSLKLAAENNNSVINPPAAVAPQARISPQLSFKEFFGTK